MDFETEPYLGSWNLSYTLPIIDDKQYSRKQQQQRQQRQKQQRQQLRRDRGWGDNNRYNGRYNSEKEVSKVLSYHYFLFPIIIFYFLSLVLRGQNLFRVKSPIFLRPPQGGRGYFGSNNGSFEGRSRFSLLFYIRGNGWNKA